MAKGNVSSTFHQDVLLPEQPRLRVLPPEIVHMIMKMLEADRESLGACALVSREFTFAALSCLGRHITINTVPRLRECVSLLTKGSAFQHVRSLDLGIVTKARILQRDLDDYLTILEVFARRRTLNCLTFLKVPSNFKRKEQERVRNVITSLGATVTGLGLCSCRFSSYAEMISLIRSFPLCASLSVRNCLSWGSLQSNMFAQLAQHTLNIRDLELTSSLGHKSVIGISDLVNDATLDISALTEFSCGMDSAHEARRALMTASASPIENLQLACNEASGFHVLADPAVTKWPLRSLTIGPLFQKDNSWCERALGLDPVLPYLESVTIFARYQNPIRYNFWFWRRMDHLLSRRDAFPRLERLNICIRVGPRRGDQYMRHWNIVPCLPNLHTAGKVYFWDRKREPLSWP